MDALPNLQNNSGRQALYHLKTVQEAVGDAIQYSVPVVDPRFNEGVNKSLASCDGQRPSKSGRGSGREAKPRRKIHDWPHQDKTEHKTSRSPYSKVPHLPQPSLVLPQPILTWVFDQKIIYQGIDISFPNRVNKPVGPRKMPFAVNH
ncbi:hypothetical protein LSAT2_027531 [Lamellibrachia satsuma]|nr:hypothetical protein LSAT2_027531 [Lamellibrachia satsuma]